MDLSDVASLQDALKLQVEARRASLAPAHDEQLSASIEASQAVGSVGKPALGEK